MKNHTMSPPSFAKRLIRGIMTFKRVAVCFSDAMKDRAVFYADTHIGFTAALQTYAPGHDTPTAWRSAPDKAQADTSDICCTAGFSPVRYASAAPPTVISGFIHTTIIQDLHTGLSRHNERGGPASIPERGPAKAARSDRRPYGRVTTPLYTNREEGEHIRQHLQLV